MKQLLPDGIELQVGLFFFVCLGVLSVSFFFLNVLFSVRPAFFEKPSFYVAFNGISLFVFFLSSARLT